MNDKDVVLAAVEQDGRFIKYASDELKTDKDFVLVPSQEGPRTHEQLGHTLAMNTTSHIRDTNRYFLYDWTLDQIHAQGGLAGYAHVLHKSFQVHRDMSINVPKNKIDFVDDTILIKSIDYYYTNPIARSSKVMSECRQISKSFLFTGIEKAS